MQTGTATHAKRDPGWSRLQCTHQSQLQCGQRCSRHPERLCHETTLQKGGGGELQGCAWTQKACDQNKQAHRQTNRQTDTDRHGQKQTWRKRGETGVIKGANANGWLWSSVLSPLPLSLSLPLLPPLLHAVLSIVSFPHTCSSTRVSARITGISSVSVGSASARGVGGGPVVLCPHASPPPSATPPA